VDENMRFTRIPHYDWIGWTIGGRVHWKSFARKVAHSSTS
jgi:hypothetical protein